jgi:hypothetical protein
MEKERCIFFSKWIGNGLVSEIEEIVWNRVGFLDIFKRLLEKIIECEEFGLV